MREPQPKRWQKLPSFLPETLKLYDRHRQTRLHQYEQTPRHSRRSESGLLPLPIPFSVGTMSLIHDRVSLRIDRWYDCKRLRMLFPDGQNASPVPVAVDDPHFSLHEVHIDACKVFNSPRRNMTFYQAFRRHTHMISRITHRYFCNTGASGSCRGRRVRTLESHT